MAPLALAAWLALDIVLRFAPLRWFGVSPLMQAVRLPGQHAPFRANVHVRTERQVGEAALAANLPPRERRAPLEFTTDSLGFRRNPLARPGARPDVLFLLGASFTYGAELSDDETLPAAFTRLTGLTAYNAGRFHTDDPDDMRKLDWLLARLTAPPAVAVLVYLDYENPRVPPPRSSRLVRAAAAISPALAEPAGRLVRAREWAGYACEVARRWWRVSPLKMTATRLVKAVSDDRVLPNDYGRAVYPLPAPGGGPLLLRDFELTFARRSRTLTDLRGTADYFVAWRDSLARRGIASYVLLVPTRHTLYGPWLERGPARDAAARAAAGLEALDVELRRRGLRTVNGLAVLGPRVPEELRTGRLSFYREDNHWNARGVATIAAALADVVRAEAVDDVLLGAVATPWPERWD